VDSSTQAEGGGVLRLSLLRMLHVSTKIQKNQKQTASIYMFTHNLHTTMQTTPPGGGGVVILHLAYVYV
jgi:hypothetical protein